MKKKNGSISSTVCNDDRKVQHIVYHEGSKLFLYIVCFIPFFRFLPTDDRKVQCIKRLTWYIRTVKTFLHMSNFVTKTLVYFRIIEFWNFPLSLHSSFFGSILSGTFEIGNERTMHFTLASLESGLETASLCVHSCIRKERERRRSSKEGKKERSALTLLHFTSVVFSRSSNVQPKRWREETRGKVEKSPFFILFLSVQSVCAKKKEGEERKTKQVLV